MIEKLGYILRKLRITIANRGRASIPFHSRISKGTSVYTDNGTIQTGIGLITSPNTALSALDGGDMIIGDRVVMNRNCIFVCRKNIKIGNYCAFGPNVCIYDHDHKYGEKGVIPGYKYGNIVIDDHCWIGANVTILRGTHIGEGCVIGAGCLIKGYIPPHSLVTMDKNITIREIINNQG